jgi:hypothetical protein
MNLYGKETTEKHTLAGRLIPLFEAFYNAVLRATNQPEPEPKWSRDLPVWCHNICDAYAKTIFRSFVESSIQARKLEPRSMGRLLGMILRFVPFVLNELPALLKEDGLDNPSPELKRKLDRVAGWEQVFAVASDHLQKPINNQDQLVEAGEQQLDFQIEKLTTGITTIGLHLLKGSVADQHQFLCGIPEGFVMFLDANGEFTGKRQRFELYVLLVMLWPEIAEMQNAQPPKTRRDLLEWLEKGEGEELVKDQKAFYELCADIGLDLAAPGRPAKAADQ